MVPKPGDGPSLEGPSVEERSAGGEAGGETPGGARRSEHVGMSSVIAVRNRETVRPRVPTHG